MSQDSAASSSAAVAYVYPYPCLYPPTAPAAGTGVGEQSWMCWLAVGVRLWCLLEGNEEEKEELEGGMTPRWRRSGWDFEFLLLIEGKEGRRRVREEERERIDGARGRAEVGVM